MEQQLHLLTGAYALNALEDDERRDFERQALTDPDTLDEVRSLSETAALLALGTTPEAPPAALKNDLMAAIRNTRQLPASSVVSDLASARSNSTGTRSRRSHQAKRANHVTSDARATRNRWVPPLSVAAALVIFAGVGVGGWVAGQNSTQRDMAEQLSALQAQQQTAAAQQEAMLGIVGAADAKIATTSMPDGGSVTVASSTTADKAAVMVKDLPELPTDKAYEMWFISAAGAVPAGLMPGSEPSVSGMQVLSGPVGEATHVGITVEPKAGSPKPTTTPIVVQAL